MANARAKEIDNTHLPVFNHASVRGYTHRDYLAHCARWAHVFKHLKSKKRWQYQHVLDVGCGKELPLLRSMYSMRYCHDQGGSYTGVDYTNVDPRALKLVNPEKQNFTIHDRTNYLDLAKPEFTYDTVVCLEVLEHVEIDMCYEMLLKMEHEMSRDGRAFISTPVFDYQTGAAKNHVNEMSIRIFRKLLEAAGFRIVDRFGTLGALRDYYKDAERQYPDMVPRLREFYDSEVFAILFAPLYPDQARNNIWILEPAEDLEFQAGAINALLPDVHHILNVDDEFRRDHVSSRNFDSFRKLASRLDEVYSCVS